MENNVNAITQRLAELHKSSGSLMEQLKTSCCIKDIWPDAYKYGSCYVGGRSRWDDRVKRSPQGSIMPHGQRMYCCYIKDGKGNKKYLTREQTLLIKPEAADDLHSEFTSSPEEWE